MDQNLTSQSDPLIIIPLYCEFDAIGSWQIYSVCVFLSLILHVRLSVAIFLQIHPASR